MLHECAHCFTSIGDRCRLDSGCTIVICSKLSGRRQVKLTTPKSSTRPHPKNHPDSSSPASHDARVLRSSSFRREYSACATIVPSTSADASSNASVGIARNKTSSRTRRAGASVATRCTPPSGSTRVMMDIRMASSSGDTRPVTAASPSRKWIATLASSVYAISNHRARQATHRRAARSRQVQAATRVLQAC